jgi:glycosyltransferase involved in cell wall biosynthesis
MKVLWLASWYPSIVNTSKGTFVQDYAQATALLCKIDVIHVEAVPPGALDHEFFSEQKQQANYTETTVLYRKTDLPIIGQIMSYRKNLNLFKQQIRRYMAKNGKPDIVHVHIAMKAGLAALWMKKKFGINYVVSEQSSMFTARAKNAYKNKNILFRKLTERIFKNASLVLPASRIVGDAINAITPIRFTVIYNCVNSDHFFYDDSFSDKDFTFIHVSTLDNNKNPKDIIEAFINFNQQYPDSRLVIVGLVTKELSRYLSRVTYSTSIIRFTGHVPHKNVALLMQQSNCLVLFSREENIPEVIQEALCCGLPVISSDVGEIHEIVNKNNGLLVPEYTAESLLESMIKMCSSYHLYNRKKIAEEARANFAGDVIAREILNKYKEVLHIS